MSRVRVAAVLSIVVLGARTTSAASSLADPAVRPGAVAASIATGWSHSCAIRADGTIGCWGQTNSGSLVPPAGTFTQVTAGADYSCGLRTDGTIACWGHRAHELHPPAGTFTSISSPGSHGDPSGRTTRISALGMALPIESGRRSISAGSR